MASIKHKIRTNQALQVLQRSTDGSSIVDACQDVGIARSTFYYFVATHPDAIASYQAMEMVSNLEQLSIILGNKLQNEQEYTGYLHKAGVGENDKVASSIDSYISYLRSVSKILNMNISPATVVNEENIENIFQRLH